MGNTAISTPQRADSIETYETLDRRDRDILRLLLAGRSNRQIATELQIPVSTVQRRTRKLFEKDLVRMIYQLNFKKLGLRRGLMHVYLTNGNMQSISHQIAGIPGIYSISIHIGNSDIVAQFVFKETKELLDIISECKKLTGVDRVVWSEEVVEVMPGDMARTK